MQIGVYRKSPDEQEIVEFDASCALSATDGIASAECAAYDVTGADVSTALLDGVASISDTSVFQRVKGGMAGQTYSVVLTYVTTSGDTTQDSISVEVVAEPPTAKADVMQLLTETTELSVIREYMAAYANYDILDSVERAEIYVFATRKYLSLAEDQISHGNESVRKEYGSVESMHKDAKAWLAMKGAASGVNNRGRIARYSLWGMRR